MKGLAIPALLLAASPVAAQDQPVVSFEWFDIHGTGSAIGTIQQHDDFDSETASLDWSAPDGSAGEWWSRANGALKIAAREEPLWSSAGQGFLGRPLDLRDYTVTTLLDYSDLQNGDVAGLAARKDENHWISIQVERIEPADLIAIRLRDGEASPPAGKLVSTTALPGSFGGRVKLRIDGNSGNHTLMFAGESGLWQVLGEGLDGSFLYPEIDNQSSQSLIGLFATDGAERN